MQPPHYCCTSDDFDALQVDVRETTVLNTPQLIPSLLSTSRVCTFIFIHQRHVNHSSARCSLNVSVAVSLLKTRSARETDVPPELRRHVLSFLVASPNTPDRNGNTALLAACENRGTPAVLELLASHGADTACTNYLGETALHVACRRGNAELAQYILDRESSARAAAHSVPPPRLPRARPTPGVDGRERFGTLMWECTRPWP